jgi:hypothetical protein
MSFWETPKAVAIIVGTTAAIVSVVAGSVGYKIGSQPPPPPLQIIFQPGSIQVLPAPAPK